MNKRFHGAVAAALLLIGGALAQSPSTADIQAAYDPALYNGNRPGVFLGRDYFPGFFSDVNFTIGNLYGPTSGRADFYGPDAYLGTSYFNPGYVGGYNTTLPFPNEDPTRPRISPRRTATNTVPPKEGEKKREEAVLFGVNPPPGAFRVLDVPKAKGGMAPQVKASITFEIKVPADAEVWLEGRKTSQKGTVRTFETAALEPGYIYNYEVRARWKGDGRDVERSQKLKLRAGERVNLDFNQADPLKKSN